MVKTATETLEADITGPESQGPGTREVYLPVNSVIRNKLTNVHENIFQIVNFLIKFVSEPGIKKKLKKIHAKDEGKV